jgi:diguanylate cyclase (GGDEF)-like protein
MITFRNGCARSVSNKLDFCVAEKLPNVDSNLNANFNPNCNKPLNQQSGSADLQIESLVTEQAMAGGDTRLKRADRDLIALAIAISAIIMFVGTGGSMMPQVVRAWLGQGAGPDPALASTMLLNIALVLFGWRRYRELNAEVRERRRAETQARTLAETDPLTGCLNRRSIGAAIETLGASAAQRGEVLAFIAIDLDNFKRMNDLNGHAAGDAVLQETVMRVTASLPPEALLARLGGDEFVCVVPFDPANPAQIDQLCGAIIDSVSQPMSVGGGSHYTTISIGLDRSDTDPARAEDLLHRADVALYHAKKSGRNRYFWFDKSMENEMRFYSELQTGMRKGIPAGEFVPYYEQQIDLATGEVVGFEMLARWNSPTIGLIGPDIFIPIAEEIGLISALSESVISQALNDAKAWDPRLTLSVNISPLQLRDPWFAQRLLKLLVAANFPPSRLEIEITESALHENIGVVRSLISSLKNQGVKVSLDDFGTGYSSLSQLRMLPFDRIKIDRSFVINLPGNKDSAAIIQAIASLAAGLGLPITAEGIENAQVLEELQTFGNFKGQGYFYGQPESASKTEHRLHDLGLLNEPGPSSAEAVARAEIAPSVPDLRKAG